MTTNLLLLTLLAAVAITTTVHATDIIVLVHGLAGWGPDEMLGFNYFGMFFGNPDNSYKAGIFGGNEKSIKYIMKQNSRGYPVYVASVGPFSANHERACELYAQIRGLRTDYGATRAALTGTDRYAKVGSKQDYSTKTPWLPNWGTAGNTDRVICIGHSMGAPTCRMLERLMQVGKADETSSDRSELFRTDLNRASAFKAVITVSGVNDGSTMQAKFGPGIMNAIKNVLVALDTVATAAGQAFHWDDTNGVSVYDFDLSHHTALEKTAGESFSHWRDRVFTSTEFTSNYNYFAHSDLSPSSQRNFNNAGKRGYANTKYLAISTSRTGACIYWPWDQCPSVSMELIMQPTALAAGNLDSVCDMYDSTMCFGDSDEENDGLVSRIATRGPHTGTLLAGTTSPMSMLKKTICDWHCPWPFGSSCCSSHEENDWPNMATGQWYYLDFSYDHLQSVGWQSTSWSFAIETPVTDIWINNVLPFVNSL